MEPKSFNVPPTTPLQRHAQAGGEAQCLSVLLGGVVLLRQRATAQTEGVIQLWIIRERLRQATMLQFLAGFTLGNVVGMYLAQNYDVPNIAKKIDAFKKDVEAKKKPPE
nr:PREDICTED: uncharacterized protein C7orf73 homolog isoform X1 [Paralichthys olivaceus]